MEDQKSMSNELREAAQAVIEWEQDYRTRNNLGKYPPSPFSQLATALAGSSPDKPLSQYTVEGLAEKFHEIYQQEAKRQGDVRHKDDYVNLPENIKEFDRVLARYALNKFMELFGPDAGRTCWYGNNSTCPYGPKFRRGK